MGQKYSSQSSSGYNTSPPPDDGSTTAANKITWATIKSKLSDVLKTFVEAVNSQLVTALDYSATSTSISYTTTAADHQKPIQATGTITISLGDATTMAAGYQAEVFNSGTGLVTVTPITGTDTLNGTAGGSVVLPPFTGAMFAVNQAANGYNIQYTSKPYRQGADVASASTVNLRTATGDYISISGTTAITAITLDKGDERTVEFQGALTLTNGASLILPGGANITTAAGDTAIFRGEAAGVVRCIAYTRAAYAPSISKQPTRQVLTSGSSATYTTPTGCTRINVRMVGGGGGGAAASTNAGTAGNNTTFSTLTAGGGGGGGTAGGNGGSGGTATGGDINIPGATGGYPDNNGSGNAKGGDGGQSFFGGGAHTGANQTGNAAATNSGSGGSGGGAAGANPGGAGGGAGGYVEKLITSPAATYTYTVGAAANGGAAGGQAGGNGAAGLIIVDEYYD